MSITAEEFERLKPAASEEKGRATPEQIKRMTESDIARCSCQVCKVIYRNASFAYRCEHWHWNE